MNPTADYFVELKISPASVVPTPQAGIAFTERFVLPTLEACERLSAAGKILAGGPLLGAMGFTFIARAESAQQLEEIVATLPIWPRAQTTVVPLASFSDRLATVRNRLNTLKASVASNAVAARN
jgi:hypothetical protein